MFNFMSKKWKSGMLVAIGLFHFGILAFCVKTNTVRGVGLDEGRYIPAGVYHWRHGEFALANDSPPLARMIAALPLLPLEVHLEPGYRGGGARAATGDVREDELNYAGRFASSRQNLQW